ncbi:MAG: hypothetical protein ACUVSX_05505 [Aggregatilineales bacterium]
MPKPGRPLGLSIAIITSVMLFSLLPLLQVGILLLLRERFGAVEYLEGGGAVGSYMLGISDSKLLVQFALGLAFLLIAAAAWRGRPSRIRIVLIAAVLFLTALTIVFDLSALAQPAAPDEGFDSSADLTDNLQRARVALSVLVGLYVIWYVNRGPARAFYRGYYLAPPEETAAASTAKN